MQVNNYTLPAGIILEAIPETIYMPQENSATNTQDLQDSERDKKYLQSEEVIIDLPDVEDIPGQENIQVPKIKEMMDVTASSDDEEGKGLFGDDENLDEESDVSEDEKELLQSSSESMASDDDQAVKEILLDNKDDDGELLNEQNDVSGSDLDVPGSELDDENEETGEEDEENNAYSLNGDNAE